MRSKCKQSKSRSQNSAPSKKTAKPAKEPLSWIAAGLRPLAERVETLVPDPKNARKHGAESLAAIAASLQRFGQRKPIVVNRVGRVIEAGNGLWEAARQLGWSHLAVVWVRDDPASQTGFAIADNRTAELSTWDGAALAELVDQIEEADPELHGLLLLSDLQAQVLVGGEEITEGLTDPDAVPEPPDDPITQPGDLWILGNHRLLCGDSSKPDQVDRLLAGAVIHLVNSDPPYNVRVEPRSNNAIAAGMNSRAAARNHQAADLARHPRKQKPTHAKLRAKDRPLANDFVSDEEFDRLLLAWFGNMARVLESGRSFYLWGGYANCANYPAALKAHKLYFSQAIIWVKGHPVLTRKDYMGDHEWCFYGWKDFDPDHQWCFYGWKEGNAHRYFGPKNATDVWTVKKVNPNKMVHLTEKPVELAIRAMTYSSHPGENVLDLFGGSGSTLIGAERTGRHAYLMEIDAAYCDVIVQRWEEYTGRKAVRKTKE